ncbi:exodeoxyribonuclease V subunit alpha [Acidipropionibacterium virtanenii]|uniref:RecBCD enzyme subunit RecD n=1 Tax=Acidipropionibacterium virtanenii TaxID=2057246 RepID=A0A344UTP2_9ACTN|nr:exodeoxyribonuclease V subunit alpha [Acidipropionibacterium virtanenii]AXE38640.1 RecBCD enzyme subunit RecD [Acidipropionibacterium virtanenii]
MPDLIPVAAGVLVPFCRAGVLEAADVHLARLVCRAGGESSPDVELAAALTVRELRLGSVQMDPATIREQVTQQILDPAVMASAGPAELAAATEFGELEWPDPDRWLAELDASPAVAGPMTPPNRRALRLDDGLLHPERYWQDEQQVAALTAALAEDPPAGLDGSAVEAAVRAVDLALAETGTVLDPAQIRASEQACRRRLSILAGGPGTGKTTTVCAILAVLRRALGDPGPVRLAAPSGKAAARLRDAVAEVSVGLPAAIRPPAVEATTVHSLLGSRGPGRGFSHGRHDPLAAGVVIVDEASMLSLPMAARLLEAIGPSTRLVLVGDPGQLVSVDAGSVLTDVVASAADLGPDRLPVTTLTSNHRSGGAIARLAEAVRRGDHEAALDVLEAEDPSVRFVGVDAATVALESLPGVAGQVRSVASRMVEAVDLSDDVTALGLVDEHRLLCAHRQGPYGVEAWSRQLDAALSDVLPGLGRGRWVLGEPVIVNRNMRQLEINNGDCGVVVSQDPVPTVVLPSGSGAARRLPCALVASLRPLQAMTVHKAQGSQFNRVTVVLPPPESPLLTRELIYTAITRARAGLMVVGSRESVVRAVAQPSLRRSGLGRIWNLRTQRGGQIGP